MQTFFHTMAKDRQSYSNITHYFFEVGWHSCAVVRNVTYESCDKPADSQLVSDWKNGQKEILKPHVCSIFTVAFLCFFLAEYHRLGMDLNKK